MRTKIGLTVILAAAVAAAIAFLPTRPAAAADDDDVKTFTRKGNVDDALADLTDAIINKGLTIDFKGNVGGMLDRTGADVGSTKKVYKGAHYITFCSAKLSRAMMEADAENLAFCPYVMFAYELEDKPGEAVIGYRRPPEGEGEASEKALKEIDQLLESIAKEAAK
jgi:hypothetical protein